ncbi:ankyrin repeat-containing domain protein [Neocallimastix lanati (nom. inval.)]|nr:ankyrin repeat-containing domain protein [Neocallimastix sp. JGI-2020a]
MGDNNTNNLKSFQQLPSHFCKVIIDEKNKIKDFYKSEILDENTYEWSITEWNNYQESDVFVIGDSECNNNNNTKSNIAIGLRNCNSKLLLSKKDYVCAKYFIYIRKLDERYYIENETFIVKHSNDKYTYFGRRKNDACIRNEQIFENFIDLETLKENNTNNYAIGVNIRIYNEMSILIEKITNFDNNGKIIPDGLNIQDEFFFEYLVPEYRNERSLNIGVSGNKRHYTPSFRSHDHIWRIRMTIHRNEDSDHDRNSDDDIYINVYLECVDNDEFLNNIYTRFTISIRNFDSYENPKIRDKYAIFNANRRRNGFKRFTFIENLNNFIGNNSNIENNNIESNNYYLVRSEKFVVSLYCRIFENNEEIEKIFKDDPNLDDNYFNESQPKIEDFNNDNFNNELKFINGYRIVRTNDNNGITQMIQITDFTNKTTESNTKKDIKDHINHYFFNNGLYYMAYSSYINEILTNCISDKEILGLKLLINYSINENIILKINKQNKDKDYPLLFAAKENDLEVVDLIINYADKRKIKLLINEHNNDGWYPLLWAIFNNNYKIAESIINYAKKNNILLDINKKNNYLSYPLLFATYKSNVKLVNLVIEYANENKIKLKINDKNKDGQYPLVRSIKEDCNKIVEALLNYASKNEIKLEINEKNNEGWYPLLWAIFQNNIEIVGSLIDYANKNKIILDMNGENQYGNYPLLIAIEKTNYKLVKQLLDYAKTNNTKIEIEKRNNIEWYPLARAVNTNNCKIVKLLIEYAFNKKINLVIYENDIDDISKIDSKILKLLYKNYMLNIIRIKMNQNSIFLENIHEKIKIDAFNDLNKNISDNNESNTRQTLENAEKNYIYLNINQKDKDGLYPLSKAIKNNNINIVKLLINYGVKNKIILNFNENDMEKGFSINNNIINLLYNCLNEKKINITFRNKNKSELREKFEKIRDLSKKYLNLISNGSVEQLKNLMENANNENIILEEINRSNYKGDYPLLMAVTDENIDLIKLLIDYANKNNFILELNKKNNEGNYPLLVAVSKKNIEIINLLIEYSKEKNIDLEINEKNTKEITPIYKAISYKNIDIIRKLIRYSNEKNIILNINESYKSDYPLLCNINTNPEEIPDSDNNIITRDIFNLLINYSNKFGIILELNKKDNKGNYPLLSAVKYNNLGVIKLLTTYANHNNIILDINDTDEEDNYPLLYATKNTEDKKYNEKDTIEIVNLLIDYANKTNIILEINKNFKKRNYPVLNVINSNNYVILDKLIKYAENNKITLELKEKHIENISNISYKILKILMKNHKANKIKIKFKKENSILLQKFIEIDENMEADYLKFNRTINQIYACNKLIKNVKENRSNLNL